MPKMPKIKESLRSINLYNLVLDRKANLIDWVRLLLSYHMNI
jgi:hypothetical protein